MNADPRPAAAGEGRPSLRLSALVPARRPALGLGAHAPAYVFIGLGLLLGPDGLNAITMRALADADPLISVTLATFGILIGAGLATTPPEGRRPRLMAGAVLQAAIVVAVVAAGMYWLFAAWGLRLPAPVVLAAVMLGLCSAASAAAGLEEGRGLETAEASRLADLDDVPIVIAGSIAVTLAADVRAPWLALALAIGSGVVSALAGVLLVTRARGIPERGVFVLGLVLLVGGLAAYAGATPLASGFAAGAVWGAFAPRTFDLVLPELRRLQHPLIGLLLVLAGASIQLGPALAWVAAPLVLLRLSAKTLGGLLTARLVRIPAGLLATMVLPPGALGIALALNLQQVLPTGDTLLLSAVTVAAAVSELLAPALLEAEERA